MNRATIEKLFGFKAGRKLYNLLYSSCNNFCCIVKDCLGISDTGNPNLYLNQQGDWVVPTSNIGSYGSFYDTTTQTVTSGQVKAMELNTTDISCTNGFVINNNNLGRKTRITASNNGIYNLQFSAQLNRTTGGNAKQIDIWIAIDGNTVPYSNSGITMQANNGKIIAAWNFFVPLNAGHYVEIMWTQNDAIEILAEAAGVNFPATPSVIATISQVG